MGLTVEEGFYVFFNSLKVPGSRLLLLHRLQQWIGQRYFLSSLLSSLVWNINYILSGCNIGRMANIAGGVVIPHPVGIVIGNGCEVGAGCWIYQNVTLGATIEQGNLAYPILLKGCQVFPGACVIGKITLGSRTIVGANSVLMQSTEDDSFYIGIPAYKIIKNER